MSLMRNMLVLFFTILFISTTFAQVNIEKYNNLNSSVGLNGNLSFYISAKTGNTDIQEFEIDGRLNCLNCLMNSAKNFTAFL